MATYSFGSFINLVRIPLLPELQRYRLANVLDHPLLHFDDVDPRWYSRLNQLYEHRLHSSVDHQPPNEWEQLRPDLEPIDRLKWFVEQIRTERFPDEFHDRIDDYYRIAGQIWTAPEIPYLTSDVLRVLFGNAIPSEPIESFMVESEQRQLAELPETLQVFRGHVPALEHQPCWTLNPGVALNWACRNEPYCQNTQGDLDPQTYRLHCPVVTVGTVCKSHIAAYVNRRNEDEILVNPDYVSNRQSYDVLRTDDESLNPWPCAIQE